MNTTGKEIKTKQEFIEEYDYLYPTSNMLATHGAMQAYADQEVKKVISELPLNTGEQEGWIRVEDRLPEERPGWSNSLDVNVLLHTPYQTVSTGSYSYLQGKWHEYLYDNTYKVTHWMPLPKPPKNPQP